MPPTDPHDADSVAPTAGDVRLVTSHDLLADADIFELTVTRRAMQAADTAWRFGTEAKISDRLRALATLVSLIEHAYLESTDATD